MPIERRIPLPRGVLDEVSESESESGDIGRNGAEHLTSTHLAMAEPAPSYPRSIPRSPSVNCTPASKLGMQSLIGRLPPPFTDACDGLDAATSLSARFLIGVRRAVARGKPQVRML